MACGRQLRVPCRGVKIDERRGSASRKKGRDVVADRVAESVVLPTVWPVHVDRCMRALYVKEGEYKERAWLHSGLLRHLEEVGQKERFIWENMEDGQQLRPS